MGHGLDAEEVAEACIRCAKGTGEGTMGFFVCGFVRDGEAVGGGTDGEVDERHVNGHGTVVDEETEGAGSEWEGFED